METTEALRSVYQDLGSRLQMRKLDTELTALLALAAAIMLVAGGRAVAAVVRARLLSVGSLPHPLSPGKQGFATTAKRGQIYQDQRLRNQSPLFIDLDIKR